MLSSLCYDVNFFVDYTFQQRLMEEGMFSSKSFELFAMCKEIVYIADDLRDLTLCQ